MGMKPAWAGSGRDGRKVCFIQYIFWFFGVTIICTLLPLLELLCRMKILLLLFLLRLKLSVWPMILIEKVWTSTEGVLVIVSFRPLDWQQLFWTNRILLILTGKTFSLVHRKGAANWTDEVILLRSSSLAWKLCIFSQTQRNNFKSRNFWMRDDDQ